MALTKVTYVDGQTVIGATNLNAIQDEIIANAQSLNYAMGIRPRCKNITSYYNDGTIWNRISGTGYPAPYWDIMPGDYIKMSRAISAYNQDQTCQTTGSQYVTVASCGGLYGNGSASVVSYNHLVMVPGQGEGGTQHFGKSRMNPTNTTVGGYVGSEMFTTTLGAVTSTGSTASTATINEQLYAEFGSHLKTTNEILSTGINASGYNRLGTNSGCSNSLAWTDVQAVLMSEIEVYGSTVWSSSGYDTGTAKRQFELFAMSERAINNRSAYYWLKDVASASCFCRYSSDGDAGYNSASYGYYYVRPRFVIA